MSKQSIAFFDILRSLGSWRIKRLKLLDYFVGGFLARCVRGREDLTTSAIPKPDSVLVIRPGGIGDAVFLLPLLKRLRERHPETAVDLLCEKRNAQIFRSQSGLYRALYCYDDWRSFKALLRIRYDLIIDTEQWHYLSALTAYFLKPKFAAGFATRPRRAKLFTHRIDYGIDTYELENFKALFRPLIGPCEDVKDINSCYTLSSASWNWAQSAIPKKSVTLFLGGSIPPRRLTFEQACGIARFLLEKNHAVVLLGGRDAEDMGERLEQEFLKESEEKRLFNFIGRLSLDHSAALIKQSKLFIGTDSGLMHLACAVGTPVVGIFGPGNLQKWYPKGSQHSVVKDDACPLHTLFGYTLPTGGARNPHMREISIESTIIKAVLLEIDKKI